MIANLKRWWHARQMRVLKERTCAAAASYLAFKARYENEIIRAKLREKDE